MKGVIFAVVIMILYKCKAANGLGNVYLPDNQILQPTVEVVSQEMTRQECSLW